MSMSVFWVTWVVDIFLAGYVRIPVKCVCAYIWCAFYLCVSIVVLLSIEDCLWYLSWQCMYYICKILCVREACIRICVMDCVSERICEGVCQGNYVWSVNIQRRVNVLSSVKSPFLMFVLWCVYIVNKKIVIRVGYGGLGVLGSGRGCGYGVWGGKIS